MCKLSKNQDLVNSFIPGDFVVYPSHGVGKIIGTEKRKVEDLELELLVVRFEHERMTLRVPLSKAQESGLRTLSSKVQMEEAIVTLKGKAKLKKSMWSRRAQEYETKINSGSLVSIAEVVRDLYRKDDQGEQSYSERQMYQAAIERLASEFAAVDNTDKDSAVTKLEKIIDEKSVIPGFIFNNCFSILVYLSVSDLTFGLGPTMLISPNKTFQS